MNMFISDLATTGGSTRAEATKVGRAIGASPSTTGSVSEGRAFDRLLTQMMHGTGEQATGQTSASMLSFLHQQLTILDGEGTSDELASLMEWLSHMLELIEQSPEVLTEMTAAHPELLPVITSIVNMTGVGNDQETEVRSQRTVPVTPEHIPGQLKEAIQQFMMKLSADQVTPETVQHARSFQQLMMPLIEAAQLQHETLRSPQLAGMLAVTHPGQSLVSEEFTARMHQYVSRVDATLSQASIHTGNVQTVASGNLSTSSIAAHPMLQRMELLHPQHLQVLIGESGSEPSAERPVGEVSQTSTMWSGEVLRTAGEWSLTRPSTPVVPQVPVQAFAQEMNQFVLRSFQVSQLNGFSEAKISLVPEHLGQVDIKLTMHNGQLTAQLITETALGRDMLEQQLGQLRQTLMSQGIQVERLEVTQQSSASTTSFLRDHGQQQQSSYQEQRQGRSEQIPYEDLAVDFEQELELVGQDYGTYTMSRSFHATA